MEGRRFTLDFSATTVEVSPFNAKTKQFPMEVRAADRRFRFVVPVAHTLRASGRDALRKAYYQIYQADQTGGLAGELTYTAKEAYPDIWELETTRARVVNLLDNDAEVVRANKPERQMVVSTGGGKVKTLAAAVMLESQGGQARVSVNGKPAGTTPVLYTLPDYAGTVKVGYNWGASQRVFSITLRPGVNAPALASPQGLERRWGRADTARLGLVVEGLSPANRSESKAPRPTLSWNAASGASGYQVQMAISRGGLEKASPAAVASRQRRRGTYTPAEPLKGGQTHYWRVRAVDERGHFGAWSAVASIRIGYSVGVSGPAGGIIFYDKGSYSDGWRYLEAAPSDQGSVEWGGYGRSVGETSTALGTGKANTEKIVNALGAGKYAARICYDLVLGSYDDWFLPSWDELDELVKYESADGNFDSFYNWSSSEISSNKARPLHHYDGPRSGYKDDALPVRAVRAF